MITTYQLLDQVLVVPSGTAIGRKGLQGWCHRGRSSVRRRGLRKRRHGDFAASSLHPNWALQGIQRIHFLRDVIVLAGAGVGGGSLVYANTLYVPPAEFFNDKRWAHITDWHAELSPYYDQATRMLGVTQNRR